jgi:hypothetical protein
MAANRDAIEAVRLERRRPPAVDHGAAAMKLLRKA